MMVVMVSGLARS